MGARTGFSVVSFFTLMLGFPLSAICKLMGSNRLWLWKA